MYIVSLKYRKNIIFECNLTINNSFRCRLYAAVANGKMIYARGEKRDAWRLRCVSRTCTWLTRHARKRCTSVPRAAYRSSVCGVKAVHTRDILCSLAKWSPEMPSGRAERRGKEEEGARENEREERTGRRRASSERARDERKKGRKKETDRGKGMERRAKAQKGEGEVTQNERLY